MESFNIDENNKEIILDVSSNIVDIVSGYLNALKSDYCGSNVEQLIREENLKNRLCGCKKTKEKSNLIYLYLYCYSNKLIVAINK